jgi:hypothetical protein
VNAPSYIIVDSEPRHAALLARALRDNDRAEIEAAGVTGKKAVWRSYKNSLLCKTAFVDGEIAAMWGLGGTILATKGSPWLLTTRAIEKVPMDFAREARKAVREMLEIKPVLQNYVLASYHKAVRLLQIIGFTMSEPFPFGPKRIEFRRFEMRANHARD